MSRRPQYRLRIRGVPLAVILALTAGALWGVVHQVDLRPYVEPNFFFSSDDPALQSDRLISDLFPQPAQIILSVRGEVNTSSYHRGIAMLTDAIRGFPDVVGVQSLTRGPGSYKHAVRSPLWRRIILAEEGRASNLFVFIKEVPPERIVAQIEAIRDEMQRPDFEIIVSGVPYVMEIIRRNLWRDFKTFSLAAFVILGLVTLVMFRSWWLVLGVLVSCANASMLTLLATHWLGMRVEVLTANLAAIVFVLCLSHLVFLTFNWQRVRSPRGPTTRVQVRKAIQLTAEPSFWSMLTTLLGFVSLLFVQAAPLRNLGRAGAVGTLVAFAVAYGIYPWFLRMEGATRRIAREPRVLSTGHMRGRSRRHHAAAVFVIGACLVAGSGMAQLNTDPSLLSYFAKGSELRDGLEYVDKNLGSSPLKIVVSDPSGKDFDSGRTYRWLWRLQKVFEQDPEVGSVLSLPLVLAEARRIPFVVLLPVEWVIEALETKQFDEVARYFLTEDRRHALFWLLMREGARQGSRMATVNRLEEFARSEGFRVDLVGGIYMLQGKLAELVSSSLVRGLSMLIGIFVIMTWILSRSLRVALAMLVSLCLIPMWLLGLIGHSRQPFDIISAPAANLAIAMGIDSMLHLLSAVRHHAGRSTAEWQAWLTARRELWWAVIYSAAIVCAGFSIFGLSAFPPTQRFGFSIILGTFLAPIAALFVLPVLAGSKMKIHMVPMFLRRRLPGRTRRR